MKRSIMGGAALAALAACGAVAQSGAWAQEGGRGFGREGGAGFERGGRGRPSTEDRTAFMEARVAALHAGLRLNADQEKLWPPVESALRALATERAARRDAARERFAALRDPAERNVPDLLRAAADRQAASAEALRKLADSSAPLYATLDEGQKNRLTILTRGLVRIDGGGERRGHGWHR